MAISAADALAIHTAIHGRGASVKLSSGTTVKIAKDGKSCRSVKMDDSGITAAEQDKTAKTEYATKAKGGAKVTWFSKARVARGRIVDGVIEDYGKVIEQEAEEAATAPAGKARAKAASSSPAKAKARAKPDTPAAPGEEAAAAKKAKTEETETPGSAAASSSSSSLKAAEVGSTDDPLCLAPLFAGRGHGSEWEPILRPVIEKQPKAAEFIGPSRNKGIVPVRELTFQALKPNPPGGWNVVSFGQSPFPRIESATGIAHFDNALKSWDDSKFGAVQTMRCMMKAALMHKYGVPFDIKVPEMRARLKSEGCVGPPEWFQAMLSQGVLFMNAACTLLPPQGDRAGTVVGNHTEFWQPVIEAVVEAILKECRAKGKGVVFAWWGGESLKTKKVFEKRFFKGVGPYSGVAVKHIDWKNPAAQGDIFCKEPNIFTTTNQALKELGLPEVDWLPTAGWKERLGVGGDGEAGSVADKMGEFIAETQDLHKMYLERLRDGLDIKGQELTEITGIGGVEPPPFAESCDGVGLKIQAQASMKKAEKMDRGSLSVEEAAAVHLYTTNFLYKKLNAALRSTNRSEVLPYFNYLRWLLKALGKATQSTKKLYRGVALDLSKQYQSGQEVTWWAVSSCTPSLEVASSFAAGASKRTLFEISPRLSVGIQQLSEYKSEEEFLLLPGTVLKVEKVEHKDSKLVKVFLKEMDVPCRVR
eukprot:CAMPEP_0178407796 /NCGR_PEP_ID=MMETSP0689_2-20121128/19611_1 /TAXON_ID=160604 /ORGANISM="Amphidinium massartii, Strain CS-259" /LENGTH=701 /DNA_ID=CAMNT_0020028877 /DNA_START=32 /DNA_END=2137 /DNA_ORIENTATION=-